MVEIVTPHYHHRHHADEPQAHGKNLGLPVLDRLFGTYHLPDSWPERYGVSDPQPDGYLRQLAWPFHAHPRSPADHQPTGRLTTNRPADRPPTGRPAASSVDDAQVHQPGPPSAKVLVVVSRQPGPPSAVDVAFGVVDEGGVVG